MCVLILYNEFKKAGAANRVPFLNTETTEEEETAFSQRTISAPEPGHCITATPITTISGLMAREFSSSSQKYISSACGQDWQNGVRTWRRVTWFSFFFLSEALQRRRWPGASDGGSLGWGRQACCCDEGTEVHQEHRRSESVLNEETQSWDLPLCLNLYLILVKSWTFSGCCIPPKQLTTSSY